jgi:hypothetical protein
MPAPHATMIIVLNGPLGIGKSTLAEALTESIDACVMLDGDRERAGDTELDSQQAPGPRPQAPGLSIHPLRASSPGPVPRTSGTRGKARKFAQDRHP